MSGRFVDCRQKSTVDEHLRALCALNPRVRLHPDCGRVVLRSDALPFREERCAVISGGGSGHEPFAAGFVGSGLLDVAVAGDVFASPSADHLLHALRATANPKGAVLIVLNYTGDRLQFSLAAQRFRSEGGRVEIVYVEDDVSLVGGSLSRVGPRGVAGALFVVKLAASAARSGSDCIEVADWARRVQKHVATFSVACRESSSQLEVGLGIHGEPGSARIPMPSCEELARLLLDRITTAGGELFASGARVIVLLNNLGGVSALEMNVLTHHVLALATTAEFGLIVERVLIGTLMSSIDMHGVSLSLLRVFHENVIPQLDQKTCDATSWPVVRRLQPNEEDPGERAHSSQLVHSRTACKGSEEAVEDGLLLKRSVEAAIDALLAAQPELDALDAVAGDGDCGSTLAAGASAVKTSMDTFSWNDKATLLSQLSSICSSHMGGTTGALYAIGLASASRLSGRQHTWVDRVEEAVKAIQEAGGARPGDHTMVDPLWAAVEEFKQTGDWKRSIKAAETAAQGTAGKTAVLGRASYSGIASSRQDPGARAVVVWLQAVLESVHSQKS